MPAIATTSADLRTRWRALSTRCAIVDEETCWDILDSEYSSPVRHYHNWLHIAECLALLDELQTHAADPTAIEFALWFHDVVYDSTRSDNEEQSALIAEAKLAGYAALSSIAAMIRATTHREKPANPDTALLCDIDLSILAAEPARYDAYASAIRREYAWVSDTDYRAGRAKVLQSFLNRPTLYALDLTQRRWENAARQNLQRELSSLILP